VSAPGFVDKDRPRGPVRIRHPGSFVMRPTCAYCREAPAVCHGTQKGEPEGIAFACASCCSHKGKLCRLLPRGR
jgi:hypothetical protein